MTTPNRTEDHDTLTRQVAATFAGPDGARQAVQRLLTDGIPATDIGVVLADSPEARTLLEEGPGSPVEAAAIGSLAGATLFGLAAAALTGPLGVLAVGPVAAALGGVATGVGAGGLLGALVGLGIPENEAALRAREIQDGGVLVTCRIDEDHDEGLLREALAGAGAVSVFRV